MSPFLKQCLVTFDLPYTLRSKVHTARLTIGCSKFAGSLLHMARGSLLVGWCNEWTISQLCVSTFHSLAPLDTILTADGKLGYPVYLCLNC